ncbi:inactive GDSL esterase/lipase-like protein 23 [Brassica rapa]|nr:inactive GDSL esterase/lipase-like protein 23 [Brassica rapa]XP_048628098.1 inactive GDSL esterase/lipase-like protein 23 [Brassica napus]XP_048629690.1 inactive GDSL esterase/lipase-like protein 23 [Brassica napus]XP_048629879.1 inactive GDSL esterase/lipase-like protein 23 [Brassica napus]
MNWTYTSNLFSLLSSSLTFYTMAGNGSLATVLGLILVLTLFHNPITVAGQSIPAVALFTFGDSNFDAGNKQSLTKANVPQGFWPYGKSRDDPNGKFSDGFIAPDFVAKFMGIPIEIPAAMKPNVNVSRGASFAVADATLLGAPVESLNLNQQVRKFNQMKASNWNDDFVKKSLFMIYIGANDYLNFTKNNPIADASAQQAFVTSVTNKLKNDISLLYASGASKFVIQTLAPLGCLPIVRQDYNTGMDQCHETLNNLAKQHNDKIGPMLNEMARTAPGFQFTVFDFYNVILRRTQRSLNYRFLVTNSSCCGVGTHNAYGCGFPNVHSKLCEYQRSYLFFDGRHNTEKAQESFGHLLFGADPNVIQPMNVRELVTYPVDEPMREFWLPTTSSVRDSTSSSSHGYEFY